MLADTEEVALSFENAQLGSSSNLIKIDRIRFVVLFSTLRSHHLTNRKKN